MSQSPESLAEDTAGRPDYSQRAGEDLLAKCLRGLGAIGVSSAFQFTASVATQIALARLLAPEVFGQYAFVAMVLGVVGTARNFNGGEYLISVSEGELGRAYRSVFTLDLLLACLTTAFTIVLSRPIMTCAGHPELSSALALLVPSCLVVSLSVPGAMLCKRMSFARLQIPAVVGQVVGPVAKISLALMGYGLSSIILGELLRQCVEVAILWALVDERPGIGLDFEQVKKAVLFGAPITISGLLAYYYWQADTYIVGRTLSMEALGLYAMAFRIPAYVFGLKQVAAGLVYAALCQMHKEGHLERGFVTITRYAAIITMIPTILVALYAEPFLRIAFGPAWIAAATPLKILMATMTLRVSIGFLADVAKVLQRTPVLLVFTIQNAIVLTVAAILLTPHWGISGCAFAVLLTIGASVPLTAWLAWKWLGVNIVALVARPALAAVMAWALAWATLPAIPSTFAAGAGMLLVDSALVAMAYIGIVLVLDPAVAPDVAMLLDRIFDLRGRAPSRAALAGPDSATLAPVVR